jgi:hypothetical protein
MKNTIEKMEISHFLKKTSHCPLPEKLSKLARYVGEHKLASNIYIYAQMQETYKEISDQLLQAGFKIPNSEDVLSFFKNKILEIYYSDCYCEGGFIDWLNS